MKILMFISISCWYKLSFSAKRNKVATHELQTGGMETYFHCVFIQAILLVYLRIS